MKEYNVTFMQYHEYTVEAESESDAERKAYQKFKNDMCSPVAHTHYDDVEVECLDDN